MSPGRAAAQVRIRSGLALVTGHGGDLADLVGRRPRRQALAAATT